MYDSTQDTMNHRARVLEILVDWCRSLLKMGMSHDLSKLDYPEKEVFDEMTPKLAESEFGSEEYKGFLKTMQSALDHHYAENPHHPEHYGSDGVNGMTLLDLVEMFADWKAASERHESGNIKQSIMASKERFGLSDQLVKILLNTAVSMGWIPD